MTRISYIQDAPPYSNEFWRRLAIIAVVSAAAIGVLVAVLYQREKRREAGQLEKEAVDRVDRNVLLVDSELRAARADALYLADQTLLQQAIADPPTFSGLVAKEYANFASKRRVFDQVRFLDREGTERVRVNFRNEAAQTVPEDSLQNKRSRYYFQQAQSLEPGEVLVSDFDLNVEHGKIEQPLRAELRFITGVYERPAERPAGFIVLNYNGGHLLEQLNRESAPGHTLLVRSDGHYVLGKDSDDAWGWLLGHEVKFATDFPEAWESLQDSADGHFTTSQGSFAFRKLDWADTHDSPENQSLYVIGWSGANYSSSASRLLWLLIWLGVATELFLVLLGGYWVLLLTNLHQSHDMLQKYVRLLGNTDGTWNWNLLTNEMELSPRYRRLLGYEDAQETISREAFYESIHPDDRSLIVEQVEAHLNDGVPYEVEFRLRNEDGNFRWYRSRGAAVVREDGTSIQMVGSIYDISDRKHVEAQLRESNAELQQFAYTASHDLQEPLRAISGFCQLLQKRYADEFDETGNGYLTHVVEGAARMRDLIADLLEYSRVGQATMEMRSVDLNDCVKEACARMSSAIEDVDGDIRSGGLPTIAGHESMLIQLFQNLIGNSLKFCRRGVRPLVSISAEVEDGVCRVRVADNGIGIAKEHHARIFALFNRLHRREEIPGTGIGLAICKRVVDRHNGQIELHSDIGQGTEFLISLPINQPPVPVESLASDLSSENKSNHARV